MRDGWANRQINHNSRGEALGLGVLFFILGKAAVGGRGRGNEMK